MPTMTIKNVSGKNSYFGYGDPSFYLVNGASQANLPYSLAASHQFQKDLEAGRIEITAGSPLITLRNLTAIHAYFGYLPPTYPLAAAAEGPIMCQSSGLPGVKGFSDDLTDALSPLAKDIAAHRVATDGTVVTLAAVSNGTISPVAGAHAIAIGSDFVLTMTPATGYHVATVVDNTVSKPTTSPYTIDSVIVDHSVAVTFAINTYAVAFDLDGGARTGGGALAQTINHGANATAPSYTPPAGYRIATAPWDAPLTNITAAQTITALYTKIWVVTATAAAHGSVNVATQAVDDGTNAAAVTATANAHYHFTGWTGDYVGMTNPYTFLAVAAAKAIAATFAHDTAVLTMAATGNGTVTPVTGPVDTATPVAIAAVDGTGTFDHWVATGGAVIANTALASTTVTLSAAGGAEAVFVGP